MEDINWLIARVLNEESPTSLTLEAAAVCHLAYSWEPKAVETVWHACQQCSTLAEACTGLFQPAYLDSEEVKWLRQTAARRSFKAPLLTPPPNERVQKQLELSEAGNVDAWLQLMMDMALEPTRIPSIYLHEIEIANSPGWSSADDDTRNRIVCAAIRFLEQSPFRSLDWFCKSGIPNGAIAGVSAMIFLYAVKPDFLKGSPCSFWESRIFSVVRCWPAHQSSKAAPGILLQMAFSAAPDGVIKCLLQEIELENQQHGCFLCGERVETVWDSRVGAALANKLREDTLKPEALRELLILLLKRGVGSAREWAERDLGSEHDDRDRVVAVASALIAGTPDAGWSTVWPLIEHDVAFGRTLLENTSYAGATYDSFTQCLTDGQLGKLYVWILAQYPRIENQHWGAGFVGPQDSIRFLREGILEQLKKRASFAACDAIATAIVHFPEYHWLRFHYDEAEFLACAATWDAPPVETILALASAPSKRLVESSTQLMDVILESLEQLQVQLHGELPAVRDLWNTRNGEWWPVDEESISDYVARHLKTNLRDRGIVINRELQIRRGKPDEMAGQNTDIHIDAVAACAGMKSIYGPISLIIEVKGCWNSDLMNDMQRQLRDRYLQKQPMQNRHLFGGPLFS